MLEVVNLRAGYGAINVLWDVSIHVPRGKLTTIVGPNGAGKTTLLRAIMGLVPVRGGEVRVDGARLNGSDAWRMCDHGMALVPEGRMVFKEMTVEENLLVGAFPKRCRGRAKANMRAAYDLFPQLELRKRQLAGALSGGEAQMLAIGRALMSEPRVLLIDEPSLGLAPIMVQAVLTIIEQLKSAGRTIVLVEQNTELALRLADHVYLMQSGAVVFSETASSVQLDQLHDLYFARQSASS
jgi:branched-chain amino acid transport system ATP-binding protein